MSHPNQGVVKEDQVWTRKPCLEEEQRLKKKKRVIHTLKGTLGLEITLQQPLWFHQQNHHVHTISDFFIMIGWTRDSTSLLQALMKAMHCEFSIWKQIIIFRKKERDAKECSPNRSHTKQKDSTKTKGKLVLRMRCDFSITCLPVIWISTLSLRLFTRNSFQSWLLTSRVTLC